MAMDKWKSTAYKYKGGSAKVKGSWVYRGKLQTLVFWLIINILGNVLEAHMWGGVLVVAIALGFRDVF